MRVEGLCKDISIIDDINIYGLKTPAKGLIVMEWDLTWKMHLLFGGAWDDTWGKIESGEVED